MRRSNTNSQTADPSAVDGTPLPANAAITRTPLYFGHNEQPLFGWYHAPARLPMQPLAMVVCPSLGHEYMSAHRSLRHLADRLAASGIPALRFDYHGTGDSSGDNDSDGRLAAWLESVLEAARTLRALSGVTKVGFVGLRMGAALATLAASRIDASSLVLWAPCTRGRLYVRELKALHVAGGGRQSESLDSIDLEAGGFTVSVETQRDLAHIDLADVLPRATNVLIVERDDLASDTRLRDKWSAAGLHVEQRTLPGYLDMVVPPHDTIVPHTTIASIVQWVGNTVDGNVPLFSESRALGRDQQRIVVENWSDSATEIRESIFRFGPGGALFGILSESLSTDPSLPVILLPNSGSTHHVGPTGLYVLLARRLAQAGFRCLRFDLPGLGDSVIDDLARENDPYVSTASHDIDAALQAVGERCGAVSFVLMGLCSGAHASFHAALDLANRPIAECVLINPLTFYYQPGMSLNASPHQHHHAWQRYMRSIRTLRGWMKLARNYAEILQVGVTVMQRVRAIASAKINQELKTTDRIAKDDLAADISKLIAAGRRLTFVFSRFDPGHDILVMNAGKVVKRFRREGLIQTWLIDRANHTFDSPGPRREMVESVRNHLVSRYSSSSKL